MMIAPRWILVLLVVLFAAQIQALTYQIDLVAGNVSAIGTIENDDTIGTLSAINIVAWNIELTRATDSVSLSSTTESLGLMLLGGTRLAHRGPSCPRRDAYQQQNQPEGG